jgi:hypothetical protein
MWNAIQPPRRTEGWAKYNSSTMGRPGMIAIMKCLDPSVLSFATWRPRLDRARSATCRLRKAARQPFWFWLSRQRHPWMYGENYAGSLSEMARRETPSRKRRHRLGHFGLSCHTEADPIDDQSPDRRQLAQRASALSLMQFGTRKSQQTLFGGFVKPGQAGRKIPTKIESTTASRANSRIMELLHFFAL